MIRLERNDTKMVRWMCKFRYEDRTFAGELRARGSFYRTEDCNGFGRLERMEERA